MSTWINCGVDSQVGDVGFLVSRTFVMRRGLEVFALWARPAQTNQSCRDRLHGWCGTTDDVSVDAHGVARIGRVCANGRAQVVRLRGDEERAALEALGYPDLAPVAA